jgi:hypothetical protein
MTIRHDVNKVQAIYIAALIQAARKVCAQIQANGGLKRTPLAAFEDELQELFLKTEQLTEFERSPQARERLHLRSDSPDLLHDAQSYLTRSPEAHAAMEVADTEIAGMFQIKPASEPPAQAAAPEPPAPANTDDPMAAFDLE